MHRLQQFRSYIHQKNDDLRETQYGIGRPKGHLAPLVVGI